MPICAGKQAIYNKYQLRLLLFKKSIFKISYNSPESISNRVHFQQMCWSAVCTLKIDSSTDVFLRFYWSFSEEPHDFFYFLHKQHFQKQHQVEIGLKKKAISNTLTLKCCYLNLFPYSRYHPKIMGDILKNAQNTSTAV